MQNATQSCQVIWLLNRHKQIATATTQRLGNRCRVVGVAHRFALIELKHRRTPMAKCFWAAAALDLLLSEADYHRALGSHRLRWPCAS